jgi:hypothetical protein
MAKIFESRKKSTTTLQKGKMDLLRRIHIPSDFLRASYVRQYLTCGKSNCRCRRGFKHGPFFYLVQCLNGGRIRKFLLKTREQQQKAREGIAAHSRYEAQLEELSQINTELLRRGEL